MKKKEIDNRRATRARIHLKNLDYNLDVIRSLTNNKKICAAVKADAYGHGAIEISKRLLANNVDFLAVATVHEAVLLRDAGIAAPIILFTAPMEEEIQQIIDYSITPFVGSMLYAEMLASKAALSRKKIGVHLKVDTGMGRLGCKPEEAQALAKYISSTEQLNLDGVCTHFAVSDGSSAADKEYTQMQINSFNTAVQSIREAGIDTGLVHAANSGAIAAWPDAHYDMVRPGIMLYGYYPDQTMLKPKPLKPLMELISKIAFIKQVDAGSSISYGALWTAEQSSRIGSIPIGYGDGYNRLLTNKGLMLLNDTLCPVAGRVCMDQTMIYLPENVKAEQFDELVIFGPNNKALDAADIAELTGTIPYEVTCAVNKRVPRDYIQ